MAALCLLQLSKMIECCSSLLARRRGSLLSRKHRLLQLTFRKGEGGKEPCELKEFSPPSPLPLLLSLGFVPQSLSILMQLDRTGHKHKHKENPVLVWNAVTNVLSTILALYT